MSLWKIRGCVLYLWSGKYYILWRFTQYKGRIVVISPIVRFFELNSSSDSPGLHHILTVHRWGIWIWSYTTEPRGNSPLENSAPVIKNTFFPPRTAIPRQGFMTPQGVSNDLQRYWKILKLLLLKFLLSYLIWVLCLGL